MSGKLTSVYIDAENVSMEEIHYWLQELQDDPRYDIAWKKAYGNIRKLGNRMDYLLQQNIKIVDTTRITSNHKNAADLRMAVECVSDAYILPDLSVVVLLTKDHDFESVVGLLNERMPGLEVITKIKVDEAYKLIGDMQHYITVHGYTKDSPESCLTNVYLWLNTAVGNHFSEEIKLTYINNKRELVIQKVIQKVTDVPAKELNVAITQLRQIDLHKWEFETYYKVISKVSNLDKGTLADIYSTAMFGRWTHMLFD